MHGMNHACFWLAGLGSTWSHRQAVRRRGARQQLSLAWPLLQAPGQGVHLLHVPDIGRGRAGGPLAPTVGCWLAGAALWIVYHARL